MVPPVQDQQDLGTVLRELRNATGRSLDTVAHHGWAQDARLTGSQIGQIERGLKRPTRRTLLAILRGIGLAPQDAPPIVQLQLARAQLDEREVGLDQALSALARIGPEFGIAAHPDPEVEAGAVAALGERAAKARAAAARRSAAAGTSRARKSRRGG